MGKYRPRRPPRPAARTEITVLDALLADLISGDDARAETAMNKLVALGERVLPAMQDLLKSPNTDHRWWALSVVAQVKEADVDLLIAALDDDSLEVRQCAALGLSLRSHPEAVSALIHTLRDPDQMLSTLATNALTKIGKEAVPALLAFLEEEKESKSARLGAMRALATIADPRAIPAMMTALEDKSVFMNYWAETGLEKLGLDMVYMKLK